jgi:peptidyl-prolyl cis-trans isomerase A (cyclophilin A)
MLLFRVFLPAFLIVLPVIGGLAQSQRVVLETGAGNITVELFDKQAPATVANFLRYVDEGRYGNASFYRVLRRDNQPKDSIKIDIVQGGLAPSFGPALPPIPHESTQQTGLSHLNGTVSMVRQGTGTARSEFFICVGGQPALNAGGKRNPDGLGFAAFGKVTEGMEVVKKMQQLPLKGQLMAEPVKIISVKRVKGL